MTFAYSLLYYKHGNGRDSLRNVVYALFLEKIPFWNSIIKNNTHFQFLFGSRMVPEFQAVLMAAGKGSRMMELTAGLPCLLTIANRPLIFYPLITLQNIGFRDVIIIVLESIKNDLQTTVDSFGLKIRAEIVEIPDNDDWGTADSLRFIADKIKHDVVVVSCDLITDAHLGDLLNLYRRHQASLAALFFPSRNSEEPVMAPGPKSKHKPEQDVIAIDSSTSRLAFLASSSDFEENVSFRRSLLKKFPRLSVYSCLTDAHVYVIKRWVCEFLVSERAFSTIKGELLPYIVKMQHARPQAKCDTGASIIDDSTGKDIFQFATEPPLSQKVREMSSYNDHSGDVKPPYHGDTIRCYAHIAKPETFGVRVNTLPAYWYVTGKILEKWRAITNEVYLTRISPLSEVLCTQMDDKCFVGDHSRVAAKTSIKNSHIGFHCEIQPKVRLTNCLVMDGVYIGEGSVLTNCIVCTSSRIGPDAELKDCIVGYSHEVPAGEKHSMEMLTSIDKLMEI